jgi:ribose-phosphate pyrophosphokinase
VLSIDLHAGQIQGFFDIPTDNLFASPVIAADIHARFGNRELMVVRPTSAAWCAPAASPSGSQRAAGDRRQAPRESRRERSDEHHRRRRGAHLHPHRRHRRFGRDPCATPRGAEAAGRDEVFAYCTHGVLSGGAATRVAKSELSELVVTDSIWTGEPDPKDGKIRRLTIAPLLAEAITRIADESSVSSLFD